MPFDRATLRHVYDRTSGYCHICHKKLSFVNYAAQGSRGAWEVEHSVPRSLGGSNHLNNLYPACVVCNRAKSNYTTKTARRWNNTTRAPLSRAKKTTLAKHNTIMGGGIGVAVGSAGGPLGALLGGWLGAKIGRAFTPRK
jgi:5-methylcytosine-specific restriction endonuclease McrA